ncbi:hypothetical protein AB1Y20_001365 [Prymnesium parvum]|uniref:Phospholipase B-like n=1 Tax=Prymnesium parvum TaxID=97485 RepID=A0AB34K7K4_PRYPA
MPSYGAWGAAAETEYSLTAWLGWHQLPNSTRLGLQTQFAQSGFMLQEQESDRTAINRYTEFVTCAFSSSCAIFQSTCIATTQALQLAHAQSSLFAAYETLCNQEAAKSSPVSLPWHNERDAGRTRFHV